MGNRLETAKWKVLILCSATMFGASVSVPVHSLQVDPSISPSQVQPAFAKFSPQKPQETVYIGGQSIGIRLNSRGVLVVGFERVNYLNSPAEEAHLQVGDVIEQMGTSRIESIADMRDWMGRHPTVTEVPIVVHRGSKILSYEVPVVRDENGRRHLGIFVRDRTSGVGTLTFYDADHHRYGALGHVITDADTGKPVNGWGHVYDSEIYGVIKGTSGKPGEKRGRFIEPEVTLGSIDTNSDFGVFGQMTKLPPHLFKAQRFPVASPKQVHDGTAQLLTVVQGQDVQSFQVCIENSVRQSRPTTKSMIIHVTDPRLLQATGGIVQGMSGSPVIQDGRLVAAVTHVFVSDPTRGYGIYAQWMLNKGAVAEGHQTAVRSWIRRPALLWNPLPPKSA